jgi:hypothetical protein
MVCIGAGNNDERKAGVTNWRLELRIETDGGVS